MNTVAYNKLIKTAENILILEKTALSKKTLFSALGKNVARDFKPLHSYTKYRPNLNSKIKAKINQGDWNEGYKIHNEAIKEEIKRLGDTYKTLSKDVGNYASKWYSGGLDEGYNIAKNHYKNDKLKGVVTGIGIAGAGYGAKKLYDHTKQDKDFSPQEKLAFLPALKAVQPYAGKAFQGAKNLMSSSWKGMSGFDKTLTVGLPAVTTLPTMFDKQDDQGRSRAERLATTGGNIAGGLLGGGLGSSVGKSIAKSVPGVLGKGLSTASSVAGAIGGGLLGEKATSAPFSAFKPKPIQNSSQSYALQPINPPTQNVIQ